MYNCQVTQKLSTELRIDKSNLRVYLQPMKKVWFRWLLALLVCLCVFLLGLGLIWAPDRSVSELSLRWAQSPSQWLQVEGMRVHLRDEGPRTDPLPLVLLHGTSASLHTWDGWVKDLATTRRVIRMDLPAFGLTGPHPNDDYSIASYVKFVDAVLKELHIDACIIAGNSLGGQIAWAYTLQKPQQVKKLILVDAAGYPLQARSVPIGFQLARIPVLSNIFQYVLPRSVIESSLRNVYGQADKVSTELVDRYYELALRDGNRKALLKRFKTPIVSDSDLIKNIQVPVLILWGAKDQLIPLAHAYHFAADIQGAKLHLFDGLGHVPHEEDPAVTVKVVQQFIQISP